MNILELLDKYPDISRMPSPVSKQTWGKVFEQATGHTRRLANDPILDQIRPNEEKGIKDYRNANRRLITKGDINRFVSKCSRIFEVSGLQLNKDTISEELKEYLASEPFYYLGQYCGLYEYTYRVILNSAIEDPNGLITVLPINENNPEVPPAYEVSEGGLPANESVFPLVELIEFDRIVYLSNNLYGYRAKGSWEISAKDKLYKPYYFYVDNTNYYRVYPIKTTEGKIRYEAELWYNHNLGYLPLNINAGIVSKDEDGNIYNESILHGYFELADEFKARFNDNQAVNVQHAYPKVVIAKMPCPAPNCNNGKVKTTDKTGKPMLETCNTCSGKGYIDNIGPYNVLLKPDNVGLGGEVGSIDPNPIQYITPPTGALESSYDNSFDLLEKARKQIGLDLLLDVSESGVAKNQRLEDLQDMLSDIMALMADTLEMMLETINGLLIIDPERREQTIPRFIRPKYFKLKDTDTLKKELDESMYFERFDKAMEYYNEKYRGDEVEIKRKKLAISYSPELLLNESEFGLRLARASNVQELIRKRDYTMIAVDNLSSDDILRKDIRELQIDLQTELDRIAPISDIIPLFE